MTGTSKHILALDVGEKRVGVAIASVVARLPAPLTALQNSENIWEALQKLTRKEQISLIIVGLPRNLQGEDTPQTGYVRKFADHLVELGYDVILQDEALTSKQAEKELESRGKRYEKSDIDSLAATYILEDYLTGQKIPEISS